MDVIYEILKTIGIVILSILAVIGSLFLILLFIDWWLKHKSGGREQEGLSDLLAEVYTSRKSRPDQNSNEKKEDPPS